MQQLADAGDEGAELASQRLRELAAEVLTLHAGPPLDEPFDLVPPDTTGSAFGGGGGGDKDDVPARQLHFERVRQQALVTADAGLLDAGVRALHDEILSQLPVADSGAYPFHADSSSARGGVAGGVVVGGRSQQQEQQQLQQRQPRQRYLALPSNGIHFCAQAQPTFCSADPRTAPLYVLSHVLSTCYLHREVREKGGAYGAGCTVRSNALAFYSYYDPHTAATLRAFRGSLEWAAGGGFTERDLQEAKLAIFADVDAPDTPQSLGTGSWIGGVADEQRQRRRTELLACSHDGVVGIARWLLDQQQQYSVSDAAVSGAVSGGGGVNTTIVGSDATKEFQGRDGWEYEVVTKAPIADAAAPAEDV
jgi:hypothetical protein